MSKPSVARAKVVALHPEPRPLTLADITVTWQVGDETKTATGAEIGRLLTQASEAAPSDAGIAAPVLRGLGDLVFPDARSLDDLGEDTRFFIAETLRSVAAGIAAGARAPGGFTVHVAPKPEVTR